MPYIADAQSSSGERMKEHVKYLASDELEGRLPGTDGIEKAKTYIGKNFEKLGLLKFGEDFYQSFDVTTGLKLGSDNKLSAEVLVERVGVPKELWKPAVKPFAVNADWLPMPFSENGTIGGELVFCGYGISSEANKYDDYAGLDVKNKVVIVLMGSPDGEGEKSKFIGLTSPRYKAVTARNNGAKAIVFVNAQGDSADVMKQLRFEMMSKNSGIIAIQMRRSVISKLFPKNSQLNPIELEINKKKTPKSFVIPNTTLSMTVDLVDDIHKTSNVIAYVKGTKYPDEFIVVGAHYDHLGLGQLGNSASGSANPGIHNGADDNASGTAGVMELAEAFANNPAERSIALMAFTGEEMGLLGSGYYAEHPLFPHEKTILMINFDMIGRLKDNKIQIFGLGTSDDFAPVLDSIAMIDSIGLVKLKDGFGPSDHSSFYKHKIPVMHFFSGTHGDYHKPSDDWDKLNYEGMAKVTKFTENVVRHFASRTNRPNYIEVKDSTQRQARMGSGAWFGIVPNFEESPEGCKISGASPGSPAQKAGLKENDIITHLNGKEVKNLHDFMFIVGQYKEGDTLKVKFLRDKKPMTCEVTLAKKNK